MMPLGGKCSAQERWLPQYGEWLSIETLAAVPSALSPEPPIPDSPHMALVHTTLPLPESRVSGCKQNFVHLLFKGVSASTAVSTWWTETLLLFTAGWYFGSFPGYGAPGLEHGLRFRPHNFQGEAPPNGHWNIPLELQLPPSWASQPSHASILPASLIVVKWYIPFVLGYKVSLQLVFSWLFRMIFSLIYL